MGQLFPGANNQLRENGVTAFGQRVFRILLLGSNPKVKVDVLEDDSLEAIIENHKENSNAGDVACRVQVIGDPTKPFGIRDKLLQFFVEEGSRGTVRDNMGPGVLYEQAEDDGGIPIAVLSKDDVVRTINGEGFTIQQPYEAGEPDAVAPTMPGTPSNDKDANAVPDASEYVDGDPDKGVLAHPDTKRVEIVNAPQDVVPGTVSGENALPPALGFDQRETSPEERADRAREAREKAERDEG